MKQKKDFELNPHFYKIMKSYLKMITTTLQPSTVENYKISIKNLISFLNSHYPRITRLSDIKRTPHIEHWLSHVANSGIKKGTRCARIIDVRRFFYDIYEWGWEDAPKQGLLTNKDLPSRDKYLPKPINPESDRKLREYLKSKNNIQDQGLLLLRKTGMRIGELINLSLNCLEKISEGEYVLHVPLGKLHTERIIPVDSETVEIIRNIIRIRKNYLPPLTSKKMKNAQFLLVRNTWKRPSYCALREALTRAVKNSGIREHITPHMLRHTYATELLRGKISLPALMKLLGHRKIEMTLKYTGVSLPDLRQAYYDAIKKSESLYLLSKSTEDESHNTNRPDYILNGIDNIITTISSIRKDTKEGKRKKRLQRIAERLRRIYQDFGRVINNK